MFTVNLDSGIFQHHILFDLMRQHLLMEKRADIQQLSSIGQGSAADGLCNMMADEAHMFMPVTIRSASIKQLFPASSCRSGVHRA